jgi:hypothetical protein
MGYHLSAMRKWVLAVAVVALPTLALSQPPTVRLPFASIAAAPDDKATMTLVSGGTVSMQERGLFLISSVASFPVDGKIAVVFRSGTTVWVPQRDFVRGRPRFASITPAPDDKVTVTLASGAALSMPERDLFQIASVASFAVDGKIAVVFSSGETVWVPEAAIVRGPISASAPVNAAQTGAPFNVGAKCAEDWATDFAMRAFCEKQQREALEKLNARSMTTPDQRTIRTKCTTDWPDDYSMRNFCEQRQLQALQQLGR